VQIVLDVFGEEQVNRRLLRFEDDVRDASPAFREMANMLRSWERRQFASEGSYASGGWAPLAASTVAQKRRKGLDPRILRATGDLMRSLTQSGDPNADVTIAPLGMTFGTSVPYARYHQTGTRRMPRRRPLELRDQDRRELVRILQRHLVGSV
jgi:phage gpG-like protein